MSSHDHRAPQRTRGRLAEVVTEVRSADDRTLLVTFASLTHIMHTARTSDRENEFRVQRDQVEDEILRRMTAR